MTEITINEETTMFMLFQNPNRNYIIVFLKGISTWVGQHFKKKINPCKHKCDYNSRCNLQKVGRYFLKGVGLTTI